MGLNYLIELRKKNLTAQRLSKDIDFLERNRQHLEDLKTEFHVLKNTLLLLQEDWNNNYLAALDKRHQLIKQVQLARNSPLEFTNSICSEIRSLSNKELQKHLEDLNSGRQNVKDLSIKRFEHNNFANAESRQCDTSKPVRPTLGKRLLSKEESSRKDTSELKSVGSPSKVNESESNQFGTLKPQSNSNCLKRESDWSQLSEISYVTCSTNDNPSTTRSKRSHLHSNSTCDTDDSSFTHAVFKRSSKNSSLKSTHQRNHKFWTVGAATEKLESLEIKYAELQKENGFISTNTSVLTSQLKIMQDTIDSLQSAMALPPEYMYESIATELMPYKLIEIQKEIDRRHESMKDLQITSVPLIAIPSSPLRLDFN